MRSALSRQIRGSLTVENPVAGRHELAGFRCQLGRPAYQADARTGFVRRQCAGRSLGTELKVANQHVGHLARGPAIGAFRIIG